MKHEPVIVQVSKEHHISQARQAARWLAEEIGLQQVPTYYVLTAISELASNLFFHTTQGGTVTLVALSRSNEIGIEIIVEDHGPGIPDIDQALEDDFSTNGGLGGGLPGVARLMDEFDITSKVGIGTMIVARKWQLCR